jgi:hypothetical protein
MSEPPRSYTGRRDLIAEKLEPYFQISEMLPSNIRPRSEVAEKFWDNSLLCSWADRETGYTHTVTVSIYRTADGGQRANEFRAMMREECLPGIDLQAPNSEAFEIAGPRPAEYVFVLYYLGHVRAIVGNCVIYIMPMAIGAELSEVIDLSKLAEVALDIGRSVGCSAYQNDFTLPEFPEEWRNQPVGWSTEGFPPYIPGLPGPKD